jgi:hypothetical protein
MVLAVKCWMENTDVANDLFLILKKSDVTNFNNKKKGFFFPFFHHDF